MEVQSDGGRGGSCKWESKKGMLFGVIDLSWSVGERNVKILGKDTEWNVEEEQVSHSSKRLKPHKGGRRRVT